MPKQPYLTYCDRVAIEFFIELGMDYEAIGRSLKRPWRTIRYEVQKNGSPGRYEADIAQERHETRKIAAHVKRVYSTKRNRENCKKLAVTSDGSNVCSDSSAPSWANLNKLIAAQIEKYFVSFIEMLQLQQQVV